MRYYVLRTKTRTDGDIDFESKECYTEASAKSQFATWEASAYTDTTYPYISLALMDSSMIPMKHLCIPTSYKAPESTEESTEA